MATILETLAIRLVLDAAEFAKGMGTVETTWAQAGERMISTGRNLTMFVTAPLVGIAVAALKTAADYETNMNQLQVITKATAVEMKALSDQALDLGKKTSFSAGEAAAAMLELGKAGLTVTQVSGAIPGVLDLAAAGGLDLARAAEIAANAVNSFGLEASETTRVANLLAAAANASSVEVKDIADSFTMASAVWAMAKQDINSLTASIALLGNAGIKGSDAGTSMKSMMLALVAPTAKAKEVLSSLNIEIFNTDGSMRNFRDILGAMESAFGGLTDAQKSAAMATIFGSDAVRAASILVKEGVEGYDAMIKVTNNATAASEMATAKTKGLAGAFEYFKGTIDTLMIETATPWLDQLNKMIRGTADMIAKFSDLPAPIQRGIVVFAALLAGLGPVLVIIGTLITAIATIGGALAGLAPIVAGAGAVLVTLTGPIGIVLAAITALAVAWNQNWFGIRDITARAIQGIKDAFNFDWGALGRGIVDGITNGIRNGWNAVTEAARGIAQAALDAAKSALGIASPSRPGLAYGENFGTSIGMGANKALSRIKADVYGQLDGMIAGLDGQISLNGNGGGGGAISINIHNSFNGNVDSATVAAGSRDGVLAALRQVGLA